ncbi:MAG: O-methyltransferase [Planctomycetota bacterium]
MNQEQWNAVDAAFANALGADDDALRGALDRSIAGGLPDIQVAPNQGKQLMLLAMVAGARRVLEIGTLGGYSTIWLARGVGSGGRVVTLELKPEHAEVARANVDAAGVGDAVEIIVGDALESLQGLVAPEPFDLVFIDADKERIPEYFEHAKRLTRAGGVVIVDNVVRGGRIADPDSDEPGVLGVRRLLERIGGDDRVHATAMQTVGEKGYDGYIIAVVNRR